MLARAVRLNFYAGTLTMKGIYMKHLARIESMLGWFLGDVQNQSPLLCRREAVLCRGDPSGWYKRSCVLAGSLRRGGSRVPRDDCIHRADCLSASL